MSDAERRRGERALLALEAVAEEVCVEPPAAAAAARKPLPPPPLRDWCCSRRASLTRSRTASDHDSLPTCSRQRHRGVKSCLILFLRASVVVMGYRGTGRAGLSRCICLQYVFGVLTTDLERKIRKPGTGNELRSSRVVPSLVKRKNVFGSRCWHHTVWANTSGSTIITARSTAEIKETAGKGRGGAHAAGSRMWLGFHDTTHACGAARYCTIIVKRSRPHIQGVTAPLHRWQHRHHSEQWHILQ